MRGCLAWGRGPGASRRAAARPRPGSWVPPPRVGPCAFRPGRPPPRRGGPRSRPRPVRLGHVARADDDLEGAGDDGEAGRFVADDLPVHGEFEARRLGLDPDLPGPRAEHALPVQIVRPRHGGRRELQQVGQPQLRDDDDVQQSVLGVGPGPREPPPAGEPAVGDDDVDRPGLVQLSVEVEVELLDVEVSRHLEGRPQVRELAPPLLELSLVGVGDLRPEPPGRHVYKEPLLDPRGAHPRDVERPDPALPYDLLGLIGVVRDAEGRRQVVAGPGGQDAERDAVRETGLAQAVDGVVDRTVAPGDDEQPLVPLPGGLARVARAPGLDPVELVAVELGAQHVRVVGAAARPGVADHARPGPSHQLLLRSLTSALVYPENSGTKAAAQGYEAWRTPASGREILATGSHTSCLDSPSSRIAASCPLSETYLTSPVPNGVSTCSPTVNSSRKASRSADT